ncbi:MAG: hypothetical protein WBW89_12560, partial [Candidatus Cybelea sp.]
ADIRKAGPDANRDQSISLAQSLRGCRDFHLRLCHRGSDAVLIGKNVERPDTCGEDRDDLDDVSQDGRRVGCFTVIPLSAKEHRYFSFSPKGGAPV